MTGGVLLVAERSQRAPAGLSGRGQYSRLWQTGNGLSVTPLAIHGSHLSCVTNSIHHCIGRRGYRS